MTDQIDHDNRSSEQTSKFTDIDRCLALLAPSQSDESKFAGMLILPRLMKHDDELLNRHVFAGMNFKFIERLLRTSQSANSEVPEQVLKEIAVNVLASFTHIEDLASSKSMADRVPALSLVLASNDKTDTTTEALQVLIDVTVSKEALVKALDPDVLKNVFELWIEAKDDETSPRPKHLTLSFQLINLVYARSCNLIDENPQAKSLASALRFSLRTTLTALSAIFATNHGRRKFDALALLYNIFGRIPSDILQAFKNETTSVSGKWLTSIRTGLEHVMTNKLAESENDQAMGTAAYFVRIFGPDWLYGPLLKSKIARKQKEAKGKSLKADEVHKTSTFPYLFVHLVAIETCVMLDGVLARLMEEHNRKIVKINEKKIERENRMIPVFFEILEAAIHFLSSSFEEDGQCAIDPEVVLKFRKTLSDTMDAIMELLRFQQDTSERPEDLEDNVIAQASMRIVALWLAEEGYEI